MPNPVIFITGAAGEIGHGLIDHLARTDRATIVTLDLQPLEPALEAQVTASYTGSILDDDLLSQIFDQHPFDAVYHLAALLSTSSEHRPLLAHEVNVGGTLKLLEHAQRLGERQASPVTFLYPSSIAAYGLPGLEAKARAGRVSEDAWLTPSTMYGCNKLYCEQLGRYYARYYRQLDTEPPRRWVDFRALRFPGLISAVTLPTGGTSDYTPEMVHAAAKGEPYACFVRPDARIPFMAMPDAVDALIGLAAAPPGALSRRVYNVTAFNPSAEEVQARVLATFPEAVVTFDVDAKRQAIVDTWPADVDDSAARRDWGFAPRYDIGSAFDDYLFPTIGERYRSHVPVG